MNSNLPESKLPTMRLKSFLEINAAAAGITVEAEIPDDRSGQDGSSTEPRTVVRTHLRQLAELMSVREHGVLVQKCSRIHAPYVGPRVLPNL